MVVGLPVLAGTTSFPATARGSAPAGATLVVARPDSRIDLVLRQMAVLHNDMRRRQPTPDDARTLAGYVRALSSYRQEANWDLEVSRAVRGLIAQEGADRLSRLEPDRTLVLDGFARYGVAGATIDFNGASTEARLKAIETIAKDGGTRYYEDIAYIMSQVEQAETVETASACDTLREMMTLMEAMAATMCLAAVYLPLLAPECLATSVVLTIMKLMMLLAMC
jgi:hypothetical protein